MKTTVIVAIAIVTGATILGVRRSSPPLVDPPAVRARNGVATLTLTATTEVATGRSTWRFNGNAIPPVIRVSPGDTLEIHYVNALSAATHESCADGPCMNMTNLHFHGMTVSPNAPQDDVLDVLAHPGQTIDYAVKIPLDHTPGLDWYHPHPHGESQRQVLDGLSGALVIEGIERYVAQVRNLTERVLVIRGMDIEHDPNGPALRSQIEVQTTTCGSSTSHKPAARVFTVNNVLRPRMALAPGERQFWRILNAAADSYLDLDLAGGSFDIVALDGMPLAYHDPRHPQRRADHLFVPPAGRVEAIVTGPPAGARSMLRTRCVDTGPDGDPAPAMVLADIDTDSPTTVASPRVPIVDTRPAAYRVIDVEHVKAAAPQFVLTFSEDAHGFYINDRKFALDAEPMVRAKVGAYQHWRILNVTREVHPMHIHQVHFLAYQQDGHPLPHPEWLDTVNVPVGSSVDVIMDFTNPIIRGMSVFHCHLLNHEDKGMMAKILFE